MKEIREIHRVLIKVIGVMGHGFFWSSFSVLTYVIELIITFQPLFTELKKLAPLLRYVDSHVEKIRVFHS